MLPVCRSVVAGAAFREARVGEWIVDGAPMRELLDGKFAPLTYSIGFLEVHPELAFEAYRWWTTRNFKSVEYTRTPIETLADALSRLEPLSTPLRRHLLLCTT